MTYPYLLFDADDTLFDFPQASQRAFALLCEREGLPHSLAHWQHYHSINMAHWAALDRGEISKEEVLVGPFRAYLQELGLSRDPGACSRVYLGALGESVFPLPHAEEVCRELHRRGHKLYIITNAVASVQKRRLELCPFGELFSAAFISEEAGAAKPQKAYYDYVLSRLPQVNGDNALIIGDSLSSDSIVVNLCI